MASQKFPVLNLIVEVGILRLPMIVGEPGQQPYRPRLILWVDQSSGMILHFEMTEPTSDQLHILFESLQTLANRLKGLPREIQMRDPQLAKQVKDHFTGAPIEVVVRESLPMLDEAMQSMGEFRGLGVKKEVGMLTSPGVTLDAAIAYAEAAKLFYDAAPWHRLIDDDLIEIESPAGPRGTRFTQVFGAGGREFGLGFVATRAAHEKMQGGEGIPRGGLWSLLFGDIDLLPYHDGELWQQHNLPLAHDQAYPNFMHFSMSNPRPASKPEEVAWIEGLLRALANTTESELDAGRWEKRVQTSAGEQVYKFSMPILLEQMSGKTAFSPATIIESHQATMEKSLRAIERSLAKQDDFSGEQDIESKPPGPAEQAQNLCYEARQARGWRQVQLARQALAIDPDCVDAMVILAEVAGNDQASLQLLQRAVEAGERQLGPEFFRENAGHFWGILQTRPYMRARSQLALVLMELGRLDEAAAHLSELLRLNPGDNQGNRSHLAQCLLLSNKLDELDELLNRSEYRDEFSCEWSYTKALLAYRRSGDSPQARASLTQARKQNEMVIPLLTGEADLPPQPPSSYSPGSLEEAMICADQLRQAWQETPGAVKWLQTSTPEEKRARQWEQQRKARKKRK